MLRRIRDCRWFTDTGQTTVEYALLIIGVAVVAGALAIWAQGGAIKKLFDSVIDKILP
jgi:Flp pilus assembly pilin Flp